MIESLPIPESVAAVVFNADRSKVLLIKRRDVPMWALPGGGIDPGELPEAAAAREVWEETGLPVKVVRLAAVYTPINRLAKMTYVYECQTDSESPSSSDETRAAGFFPPGALPSPFFFLHAEWIDDVCQNHPEVIRKELSHITYFELFKYFLRDPLPVIRLALSRLGFPINSHK